MYITKYCVQYIYENLTYTIIIVRVHDRVGYYAILWNFPRHIFVKHLIFNTFKTFYPRVQIYIGVNDLFDLINDNFEIPK